MGFLNLPFLSVDSTVINLAAALHRSGKLVFKKRSIVPRRSPGSSRIYNRFCLLKFWLRELKLRPNSCKDFFDLA